VSAPIGHKRWAIAEGYIPGWSNGPEPQFTSHETACLLNTSDEGANVEITLYFEDKEPAGPYRVTVPARRTRHVRFNELTDPEPVPTDMDYVSLIESDVPIVVQHTRLDSRQAENALLTTIAYASHEQRVEERKARAQECLRSGKRTSNANGKEGPSWQKTPRNSCWSVSASGG
jgi:hypothetical protein